MEQSSWTACLIQLQKVYLWLHLRKYTVIVINNGWITMESSITHYINTWYDILIQEIFKVWVMHMNLGYYNIPMMRLNVCWINIVNRYLPALTQAITSLVRYVDSIQSMCFLQRLYIRYKIFFTWIYCKSHCRQLYLP